MKTLTLAEVKKNLPFKTHHVNLWWSVKEMIEDNYNVDFDVFLPTKNISLQRPLCWTLAQKQELIMSIIKQVYIPKICVVIDKIEGDDAKKRYQIIDGKQRLNAMLSFVKNEFPITHNGCDFYFKDCDSSLKNAIGGYCPNCEAAYSYSYELISDNDKIAWFEQINFTGTPQDKAHLDKLKGLSTTSKKAEASLEGGG